MVGILDMLQRLRGAPGGIVPQGMGLPDPLNNSARAQNNGIIPSGMGLPGQQMPGAMPMTPVDMPGQVNPFGPSVPVMPQMGPQAMGPMTPQAPMQETRPKMGLRATLGLDEDVGRSGFTRGEMAGMALSDFGSRYGRNANGGGSSGMGGAMTQMVMARAKERQAQSDRQELAAQMRVAGYSDQDVIAIQFAPEQAIKAIMDRKAGYTLEQGQARYGEGGKLEANNPKFSYQNDTILREGPTGVENMGRLDPSYSDINTQQNNQQQNAIGWANVGIGQQNATTAQRRLGVDAMYNKPFAQAQARADVEGLTAARDASYGATMNAPLLDELQGIVKTAPYGSTGAIAKGWDAVTVGGGLFGEGQAKDKFDRAEQIVTKIVVPLARMMAPVSNTDFMQLKNTIASPTSSKAAVEAAVQTLKAEGVAAQQYESAMRAWAKNYGSPSATDQNGRTYNQFFSEWLNANRAALGYPVGAQVGARPGAFANQSTPTVIDLNGNVIK